MSPESEEAWQPVGIDALEPAAWDALRHNGSCCVIAGPGAGKTEFLAQRACFLLETGRCRAPKRILAISFKRDAATNLAMRVRSRAGAQALRLVSMTFDQFTKRIVDRFRASIREPWAMSTAYSLEPDLSFGRNVSAFLDNLSAVTDEWRSELYAIPRETFLPQILGAFRLSEHRDPASAEEFAIRAWWESYYGADPPRLEFTMLNRLAEFIIRTNPQIRRALRLTFPFVFVDEFQDTTFAQYDFLTSVFGGTSTVVTAVGDNKQRIMGFAGAMPDAFEKFREAFDAEQFELLMNFRSSPALVKIQHVVAASLDSESKLAVPAREGDIAGDAAQIWQFATEDAEARHVSRWIAADVAASTRRPSDYALLTKQKADDFERVLAPHFAREGLMLRNDSARIGRLMLQDLLVDELTQLLLAFMRLGSSRGRPSAWNHACTTLAAVRGVDPYDPAESRVVADEVSNSAKQLRRWMSAYAPNSAAATSLVDGLLALFDRDSLRRCFVAYRDSDALDVAEEAFRIRLADVVDEASSWEAACDRFEGSDAVPLMTVHKSKGLEYHTIIFLGIDDAQWWSHTPGQVEGQATFFVGLSRAQQRAMFTFCRERGTRTRVSDLYDLIRAAGVAETTP